MYVRKDVQKFCVLLKNAELEKRCNWDGIWQIVVRTQVVVVAKVFFSVVGEIWKHFFVCTDYFSGCQFPTEWHGVWFQSTVRPYITIDSRVIENFAHRLFFKRKFDIEILKWWRFMKNWRQILNPNYIQQNRTLFSYQLCNI